VSRTTLPVDDVVEELVGIDGTVVGILRPRSSEELLSEAAFERDEFLPYWADLWPSALALARALAAAGLQGRRVLELGCGLGLPSIVAAVRGARVLAIDWAEDAVAFARVNAERNGVRIAAARVSWAEPEPLLRDAPFDLVVAADVLYEQRNVDELLELLPRLVDGGDVWIADPGRVPAERFVQRAREEWHVETTSAGDAPRVLLHRISPPAAPSPMRASVEVPAG
jgi:predicted nicotinamide N-methyase